MSSNLKVNSLVPATGTEIGIGTTGGSIDFRCPATFGGNVTIGGTLTYDEVINIDSIGIITARTGLNVSSGTATFAGAIDANGDLDVDGHTNLDNVSIAGVTTTSGNIIIENAEPSIFFTDTNGNPDYKIFNDSGALKIYDTTYSATRLQIGPTNGEVTIASNTNFPNGITMNPGTASVVNTIAQRLGDTDTKIRFPAADTFSVETAGSERLRITSAGKVGINDNSPAADLSVKPTTAHCSAQVISGDGSTIVNLTSVQGSEGRIGMNSNHPLAIYTNGLERLRITSGGLLKVNSTDGGSYHTIRLNTTTNNAIKDVLHVHSSVDSAIAAAGFGVRLNFSGEQSNGNEYTFGGIAGLFSSTGATYGALAFYTNNNGTNGERLRITENGVLKLTGQSSSFETAGLTYHTNGNLYIRGGTTGAILQSVDGNEAWIVQNDYVSASTAGSERVRIDSNGQLLVGTTTSGANVRAVFQGYNGGGENFQARVQFQTNQQTNLTTNQHLANLLFANSSSSIGAEIRVQADENWGTSDYPTRISFMTTANGSGTRYDRMIIKNDGIINIGVASPQYAKKVNIQGDNGYTLSLSNQDYTGHAAGSLSGIEGRIQCGGGIWSSSGVRFVKHNGTSGDKHSRLELYANDGYASRNSLIVNPEGEITKPYQPSFRAGLSGNTTVNTNAYIVFNDTGSTWHHNTGNHYSTSNGRFTAPVDGVYQFNICVIFGPFSGTNNVFMGDAFLIYVNGGNAGYSGRRGYYISGDSGNNYYTDHMSVNLKLSATDYVQVRNGAPFTAIHGNTYYTWFAGTLLG